MYIETMSKFDKYSSLDSYFLEPEPESKSVPDTGLYKQFSNPVTGREVEATKDAPARFLENLPSYLKEKLIETLALGGIVNQYEINRFIQEKLENTIFQGVKISSAEVEEKIERIDSTLYKKITDSFSDEDIITLFLASFIGRANPPHPGHIKTMLEVILEALRRGGTALILLGSGPGKKTNDKNPIPFVLKRFFIAKKLKEELEILKSKGEQCLQDVDINSLFASGRIRIEEMGKQVEQHREVFKEELSRIKAQTDVILQNILYVGNKKGEEDDTTKLKFVTDNLIKNGIVYEDGTMIPVEAKIEALTPIEASTGEAMSATIVRKYAVDHTLEEFRAFSDWHFNIFPSIDELIGLLPVEEQAAFIRERAAFDEKYALYIKDGRFDFAEAFWNIIREENDNAIEQSLNPSKKPKGKKGGFKSIKRKQTKRKQTKRKQTKRKQTKKRRTKRQTKKR